MAAILPARLASWKAGLLRRHLETRGVGRELMRSAEDWARALGARDMASDALIDNDGSQRAHAALGFEVVDPCVHFRKAL